MSEFREGDRVRLPATEAVVDAAVPGGRVYVGWKWYDPADLTLIDRPAPTPPTEPGTTGTATVRGVEGVRVMRTDGRDWPWVSERHVAATYWHRDSELADFVPDPPARGAGDWNDPAYDEWKREVLGIRSAAQPAPAQDEAATPPPDPDLCKCGHTSDAHERHSGPRWCHRVGCYCPAYRPAQPDGCTCTRGHGGHIVAFDSACPLLCGDPVSPQHEPSATEITDQWEREGYRVQPEPTGLVERVAEQITDNGHASTIGERATAAALAVATWLDENGPLGVADLVRREVEGSGT